MSQLEEVLSKLQGVKPIAGGYQVRCPCHDDQHQSLSVREENGKLLLYCHAGCSFENIIKKLGLHPDKQDEPPVITDVYDYTDADGNLLYQVVRFYPKNFKQRRPDGKGGWLWGRNHITQTLFRLPELIDAIRDDKLVFIVEGEKDVWNLRQNGQVATTISGGVVTKWHPSLVPLFDGARVVIIPDNDEAGRKYANYVANLLYGWCASLKMITLRAKDVSDHLILEFTTDGKTPLDNLLEIIDNTGEYIPKEAVTRDEFNAFRGINQYLWREIIRLRKPRKYKYS